MSFCGEQDRTPGAPGWLESAVNPGFEGVVRNSCVNRNERLPEVPVKEAKI